MAIFICVAQTFMADFQKSKTTIFSPFTPCGFNYIFKFLSLKPLSPWPGNIIIPHICECRWSSMRKHNKYTRE